jgi:protease I
MREKVALIIASRGYQSVEYGTPKKMLVDAGYEVITASNIVGTAIAQDQSTTHIDMLITDIEVTKFVALVFIGGPGAMEHLDNTISYELCQDAVVAHIPIGAICTAPRILASAGVLQGRMATGWNGDGKLPAIFSQYGISYAPEEVVSEDLFVTATGPRAAEQFGQQIIDMLNAREDKEHD